MTILPGHEPVIFVAHSSRFIRLGRDPSQAIIFTWDRIVLIRMALSQLSNAIVGTFVAVEIRNVHDVVVACKHNGKAEGDARD